MDLYPIPHIPHPQTGCEAEKSPFQISARRLEVDHSKPEEIAIDIAQRGRGPNHVQV